MVMIDHLIKRPPYFGTNFRITYEALTNLGFRNLSDTSKFIHSIFAMNFYEVDHVYGHFCFLVKAI